MTDHSRPTFIGSPICSDLSQCPAGFAVIGAPHCVLSEPLPEILSTVDAPAVIRAASTDALVSMDVYDFDLGATLFDGNAVSIVDCGDVPGSPDDPNGNRARITETIETVLERHAIPMVIGGDDSVPIAVLEAYRGHGPLTVIQIDAHLDWRDQYNGVRHGHGSTMRRASEMSWVHQIIQVGMHGAGGATPRDYLDARNSGAKIIPARDIHRHGVSRALDRIPEGDNYFITLDCDGLDAATLPAATFPMPGGLFYHQVIELIHGILGKGNLIGFDVVEFAPAKDVNGLSALTLARIMLNVVGGAARRQQIRTEHA